MIDIALGRVKMHVRISVKAAIALLLCMLAEGIVLSALLATEQTGLVGLYLQAIFVPLVAILLFFALKMGDRDA